MLKLNLGAGGDIKEGWRNLDITFAPPNYINIAEPLPFADTTVDVIYSSHTVEHVDSPTALRFFDECFRVLKPGGVVRIAVPSVSRIAAQADQQYLSWLGTSGFGEATLQSALRNIVLNHGHKSCWSFDILESVLQAAGFMRLTRCEIGQSTHESLRNVECHGKVIGEHNNAVETIVVEAVR